MILSAISPEPCVVIQKRIKYWMNFNSPKSELSLEKKIT
jgi:hypothetical protein